MRSVNIHEAKTHLSRLVEAAARGEGFIIAKAGRPMVKVVPLEPTAVDASRRIGSLKGTGLAGWWDSLDHATLDREIERSFVGEEGVGEGGGRPSGGSALIGAMKGRIAVPDDFDAFGREEIAAMFGLKE